MVDAKDFSDARDVFGGLPEIALSKTGAPLVAKSRIERKHLLEALQQATDRRLILLKAPAGYGKTTLGVDWAALLRRAGAVVAWLSLDADDNEPTAFAYHLTKSLYRAAPELGQAALNLLAKSTLIEPKNVLAVAINAVAEGDDEVFLFLDDYHLISEPRSQALAMFLLQYAPSNLHVVVMSRTDPMLPVAKLSLVDDVAELDIVKLRFTREETEKYLAGEQSLALARSEIAKLHDATEGWPAALQLARIAVRNASDPARAVKSLSGATRQISSYIDETLATQTEETNLFLLKTAILDRFNTSLCEAVTGSKGCDDILKALQREQFLLVALDEHEGLHRYHHLMSEYLLARLNNRMADQIPDLHRRAYRWYAARGSWSDAVRHALAAEDFDQALRYVEQCAMGLVVKGDLLTLLSWERKLPAELMKGQVEVKLALAWGLILVTRLREGAALLAQVEQAATEERTPDLWWRCRATRGVLEAVSDNSEKGLALGLECQGKTSYDPFYKNALGNVMRFGYWKSSDLASFYSLPKPDLADGEATYVLAEQYRLCLYGMAAAQRLHLDQAKNAYDEARRLIEKYAGGKSAAAAIPTGLSAGVRYEQGDSSTAEIMVLDELDLIETAVFHESFLTAHLVLVRAAYARKDKARAYAILERAEKLASDRDWVRPMASLLLARLRLLLADKRSEEVRPLLANLARLKASHPVKSQCSWTDIHISYVTGKGLFAGATGQWLHAVDLLSKAHSDLLAGENNLAALGVAADLTIALAKAGRHGDCLDLLKDLLGRAADARAVGSLLDRGRELMAIVATAERDGIFAGDQNIVAFVADLTARARHAEVAHNDVESTKSTKQHISQKERTILEYISSGQSNKEIARALGVTPETIKTHVKRIFAKLSAESRAQAVVRAQSLGLLHHGWRARWSNERVEG